MHAKHILVDNEAEARRRSSAQLKGGADFAALAKQYSKDPGGAQQGGDLGFFKKDEMVPEFATAAFALQPGSGVAGAGAQPVRLARDPGGGATEGRAAEFRSGAQRTAPEDDPGGRAEGRREGACLGVGGEVQSRRFAGPGDRSPPSRRPPRPSNRTRPLLEGKRPWPRQSLRLPFRCRNCRRSPACVWAPRRRASATRGAPTW